METRPIVIYEPSREDQSDENENTVLRSLVGDPNRHQSLVEHTSPSMISSEQNQPSSMYTIETRYQPIPSRVLPKHSEPKVYYIGSKQTEEPPYVKEERNISYPVRPEKQSFTPTVFLAPKVMSQPILYNIVGAKTSPVSIQPMSITKEPASPTLYAITGRPRRLTVDMSVDNSEVPAPITDKPPALYSTVGNPRTQEPTKQLLHPSPNFYSIVGSPARTSRGVQVNTLVPIPPSPILYTIVADKQVSTNIPKENRPPSPLRTITTTTVKKQPNDITLYTIENKPDIHKMQQRQQPVEKPTLHKLVQKPTLYTLVGKPNSPPQESMIIRTRPPARKKTPPPSVTTVTTQRISRSVEQKPEVVVEEVVSHSVTKTKRQPQSKEPTILKSETTLIHLREEDRRPRPQPPHTVTQYQQVQLSDYNSPYTFRTQKPFRERKYNNNPLPVISNSRSERKPRPPLYEPRYRAERHHPFVASQATSLERNPVNTKLRPSLWDNGYQTQTDDDEEYENKINKKKTSYRRNHARTPWIPVW